MDAVVVFTTSYPGNDWSGGCIPPATGLEAGCGCVDYWAQSVATEEAHGSWVTALLQG